MNKKNVALWTLYDFANSIPIAVFLLYFSQWLVVERGVSDIWFNFIFIGSTVLLLLTAPVAGTASDQAGVKMPFLRLSAILLFALLTIASLTANFIPSSTVLAITAFTFAAYFYQFSLIFYNALLYDIAPPRLQGFISGLGQSANWIGQITGLLIALPIATGAIAVFGKSGRAATFVPATILFVILAAPMVFFFKEKTKPKPIKINLKSEYKNYISKFIALCKQPGVGRFLLAFFFFNDAVVTATNNFPIYLEKVFHVSDQTKTILLLGILATAAIGALAGGWVSDKIGLKKALNFILGGWIVVFPLLALFSNFLYFTIATVIMGLLFGATWTVARAIMTNLAPPDQLNQAFSYYTVAERFATFVGPVAWGLTVSLLVDLGALSYRIAALLMGLFVLVGFIIVRKIPEPATDHRSTQPAGAV